MDDGGHAQLAGRQPDRALPPVPLLVRIHGVHVADPRALPRVQREPAVLIFEEQPDLFGGILVVLDSPRHGLVITRRGRSYLLPGQQIFPVELVRPLKISGVPVRGEAAISTGCPPANLLRSNYAAYLEPPYGIEP